MARAIAPQSIPQLPAGAVEWRRSTKRAGGIYHAHCIGFSACGTIRLGRHQSEAPSSLGDMQYWGICPRCFKLGGN